MAEVKKWSKNQNIKNPVTYIVEWNVIIHNPKLHQNRSKIELRTAFFVKYTVFEKVNFWPFFGVIFGQKSGHSSGQIGQT